MKLFFIAKSLYILYLSELVINQTTCTGSHGVNSKVENDKLCPTDEQPTDFG